MTFKSLLFSRRVTLSHKDFNLDISWKLIIPAPVSLLPRTVPGSNRLVIDYKNMQHMPLFCVLYVQLDYPVHTAHLPWLGGEEAR